jgi:GDSL-like Lipase/Acylhydrolase family
MGANKEAMCFVVAFTALFSTPAARAEVRIVSVGDSSFLAVGVPQNQTYPAQLEAALRARGHQVAVTNQSVSGDTATGVLQRLDSAVPPGTDIVILKIGEHELKFYSASPDAVAANRRTIVERLHAKGVEVYRVQDPAGLVISMERGLTNAVAKHLIVEPNCSPTVACHANAAGLAIAVRRTLPAIEALVRKVEKQGACRPECASQTASQAVSAAATCTGLKLACLSITSRKGWCTSLGGSTEREFGRDCEKQCNFIWEQCMKSGFWEGAVLHRQAERR